MRRRSLLLLPILVTGASCSDAAGPNQLQGRWDAFRAAQVEATSYTVALLPAPAGGTSPRALSINRNGDIAGASTFGVVEHPTIWTTSGAVDLGLPAGTTEGWANAINDAGTVVGTLGTASGHVGFVWTALSGYALHSSPGALSTGFNKINNSGTVVGDALVGGVFNAFIWSSSTGFSTLHPVGVVSSSALDISNTGTAVGFIQTAHGVGHNRVAMWASGGTHVDVGIPSGATSATGQGINDAGIIVGVANNTPMATSFPFAYVTSGTWQTASFAGAGAAISSKGRIVGTRHIGSDDVAITSKGGTITRLPAVAGMSTTNAAGVNRCGTIVGYAYDPTSGAMSAVKWTPSMCD